MATSTELFDAYWKTTYRSEIDGQPIAIHPGKTCPGLDAILKAKRKRSWAFVTACNPHSIPATAEANQLAQEKLRKVIERNGWTCFPGSGEPGDHQWLAEPSFLVLGITCDEARSLGVRFAQNAVVFGELNQSAEVLPC